MLGVVYDGWKSGGMDRRGLRSGGGGTGNRCSLGLRLQAGEGAEMKALVVKIAGRGWGRCRAGRLGDVD